MGTRSSELNGSEQKIQHLISQAYDGLLEADPARLEQIEYTIKAQMSNQVCNTQPVTIKSKWWIIGLAIITTGAVAWWSIQQISSQEVPPESPVISIQSATEQGLELDEEQHMKNIDNVDDNEQTQTNKPTDQLETVATTQDDQPDKQQRKSNVIFQREIF